MYEYINKTPCKFCGKMYNRGGGISSHESACERKSLGLPPPARKQEPQNCPVCKRLFQNSQALGSHKKTCIPVNIVLHSPNSPPPLAETRLVQSTLSLRHTSQTTQAEEEPETSEPTHQAEQPIQEDSDIQEENPSPSLRLNLEESTIEATPAQNVIEITPSSQMERDFRIDVNEVAPVVDLPAGFRKIDCFHLYKLTTLSLRETLASHDLAVCQAWSVDENPFCLELKMAAVPDQSVLGPETEEINTRYFEELVEAMKSNAELQIRSRLETNQMHKDNYCNMLARVTSWDHVRLLLGLAKTHLLNTNKMH